jgi:hypothetical protein
MRVKLFLFALMFSAAFTSVARAQCPTQPAGPVFNPKDLCFVKSPDHSVTVGGANKVDGYKAIIKKVSDGSTVSTTDLGKPTPDAAGAIKLSNWTVFTTIPTETDLVLVIDTYGRGLDTLSPATVDFIKPLPPAATAAAVVTP